MVHKIKKSEKYKAVELPINWDKQISMAVWSEKDAKKIYNLLKPMKDKAFVLYGGGGWESHIVKLKDVKIGQTKFRTGLDKPMRKGFYVQTVLKTLEDWKKDSLFQDVKTWARMEGKKYIPTTYKERTFDGHLGSWKLQKIERVK